MAPFLHCSVFLVRESTTVSGCFVLTMYAYGTFRNFQIQKVRTAQPYHHPGAAACDRNHMSLCTCQYYAFTYHRIPDCQTLNSINYNGCIRRSPVLVHTCIIIYISALFTCVCVCVRVRVCVCVCVTASCQCARLTWASVCNTLNAYHVYFTTGTMHASTYIVSEGATVITVCVYCLVSSAGNIWDGC